MTGKSQICKKIILNKDRLFARPPEVCVWVYQEYDEDLHSELQELDYVVFTKELSDIYQFMDGKRVVLVVVDDRVTTILKNSADIIKLFVQTTHHYSLIFILVLHAIFIKDLRLANLQTSYLILTKALRDPSSTFRLSYQLDPLNPKFMYSAYLRAIKKKKFVDFCICMHVEDDERTKYRSSVFFWEGIEIYLPASSTQLGPSKF